MIRRAICAGLFALQDAVSWPGGVICHWGAVVGSPIAVRIGGLLAEPAYLFGRAAWRWFDDCIEQAE